MEDAAPKEQLTAAFMAFRERNGGCPEGPECGSCKGIAEEESEVALSVFAPLLDTRPQPTLDRDAVWEAVVAVRDAAPRVPNDADSWDIVDAVCALVRPLPTREQIAEALWDHYQREDAYPCSWENVDSFIQGEWMEKADTVLALFTGGEE